MDPPFAEGLNAAECNFHVLEATLYQWCCAFLIAFLHENVRIHVCTVYRHVYRMEPLADLLPIAYGQKNLTFKRCLLKFQKAKTGRLEDGKNYTASYLLFLFVYVTHTGLFLQKCVSRQFFSWVLCPPIKVNLITLNINSVHLNVAKIIHFKHTPLCFFGPIFSTNGDGIGLHETDSMMEMIWTLKATAPNHCSALFHQHAHEAWCTFGPTEVHKDSFEKRTAK